MASVGAGLGGSVAFQKLGLLDKLGVPAASPWRGRVKAAHREVGTITWAVAVAVAWMGLSYPKRFMGGWTYAWLTALIALVAVVVAKRFSARATAATA